MKKSDKFLIKTERNDKMNTENRTGGTFFTFDQDGTAEKPNTLTIQVANGVTSIPDELFSENSSGNLRQSYGCDNTGQRDDHRAFCF